MKALTTADFLMDIFYKNYPHLDKHNADIQCVSDILTFIVNQLGRFENNRYIIDSEDITKVIIDLMALKEPSTGHHRRDLDAL